MRPPAFWQDDGPAGLLLSPLGACYDGLGRLRRRFVVPRQAGCPVLCVGNATAGGTGKTPIAIDLALRLTAAGRVSHLLTRGYGGRLKGPVRVDPGRHDPGEVGDEALLLARAAPTWLARNRAAGARAAVAAGAEALVLDDGLQNPGLEKDLSFLVIDGATGFGNARVMPAGPLREALSRALDRADAAVLVGPDRTGAAARLPSGLPVLQARLRVDAAVSRRFAGQRVVAFAGIGRPDKFFDTLEEIGAEIAERHAFDDHHAYRRDEVAAILDAAGRLDAIAVTTEKDAVRLPGPLRARVAVLPVRIAWSDKAALRRVLAPILPERSAA